MKLSGPYLKRYKEILTLLWKYGRSDLVQQMGADEGFDLPKADAPTAADVAPEQFANDLEAMGPTYVKLGQVLAGRPDLLPQAYLTALARLQDHVKPFPYEDVERIVLAELGVRISKAFSRFDIEPIAAASLGQVHGAALRDGRAVVVKVQRPDIRQQIAEDFEVLAEIAAFMDEHTAIGKRYRFQTVLEEFRLTIQNELNYELEAHNLVALGRNLRDFPLIFVPQPVRDYCTRSVLTMDYVRGQKITSLSPLSRLDIKGAPLVEELFRAYLKQVLVDGLFHADPHPGNVFITDDGRIALLDLGMVGHTAPGMQDSLLKLLLAVSEGKGEEAADIAVRMSEKMDGLDLPEFRRQISHLVALHRDQGLEQINVGQSLLDVSRHARENGLFVPSELTLLGKTLLQLDEVGRILDPTFDPNACIRRSVTELTTQRMQKDLTQGNLFSSLLEAKDFFGSLPARLNRIMDAVTNSELHLNVRALDTKHVLDGMQKIANRITTGLILAALIIGAALLMRVRTHFEIFGYPGLAIICFLLAGLGGFYLVINIFVQDYKSRKKLDR
ncbi:AarF/ABC1/UbiB kinase family protein [Horticoccus luteus]|uniref:AarF/ABC1/UbiB kinase family protein n=1 Tax=Horticoccus luteus TaxID=2862869 RepID=A0A8F9TUR0_9BACT|nr:AarF/UbiB family protein [Horticoccus luteus]QYM79456.1 AarF/ABC1/UbiB kinase family protein [Horticoccus luteus]